MSSSRTHPPRLCGCSVLAIAIACAGGLGCSKSEPPAAAAPTTGGEAASSASPAAEATPADAKRPEPDRKQHMLQTFWTAVEARDALIQGNLKQAAAAADALATRDYASVLPSDWKPWIVQMQAQAKELSMAPDLASASQALGKLALACGDCHYQQRHGISTVRVEALPWKDPPEQLNARMDRHQIGAEQLWAGLVVPSEEAWRSGTVSFTRAPLEPSQHRGGEPIDEALRTRIEGVRELAKQARTAGSYAERGRVYGELIASCAECHYATARPR